MSSLVTLTTDFGAMEHAGLVTYASTLLLASPAERTPQFERDYVAVAAHELAHQWFGNLVTLAWWDDLWLNESFASWMGDRITDQVMPQWQWHTATQRARTWAMRNDRLLAARRIQQPVTRDDDIGNLFDGIAYDKGQSVLSMFEAWLGEARFRDGVRRYMARHAWGNATGAQFFDALAEQVVELPDHVLDDEPRVDDTERAALCATAAGTYSPRTATELAPHAGGNEACLIVSLTFGLAPERLPPSLYADGAFKVGAMHVTTANADDLKHSVFSHTSDIDLFALAVEDAIRTLQDQWCVSTIHLFIGAPASACFKVGQKLQARNHATVICYESKPGANGSFLPTIAIANTTATELQTHQSISLV